MPSRDMRHFLYIEAIMKKAGINSIIAILVCLMCMLFAANAFAQDNETQDSESFTLTRFEFNLGIGEGINVSMLDIPLISVNAALLGNVNSFWRTGMDYNFMLTQNRAHNEEFNTTVTLLYMNEFVLYRGKSFEFAPRLGLGYHFENRSIDNEMALNTQYHMFAANFGLGFDWRVSQLISLGLNLDYLLGVNLTAIDSDDLSNYDYERGDVSHSIYVKFNIGFHL